MLSLRNIAKKSGVTLARTVASEKQHGPSASGECTCPCCSGTYLSDLEPAPVLSAAPTIKAKAWHKGFKDVNLADYKGKYVVLFFYPMDFTFVCPTEIIEFSKKAPQFRENSMCTHIMLKLDCEVIGCSTDSVYSHMEYDQKPRDDGGLGGLDIPLIGDISKDVADSFGVLVRDGENKGVAFRYPIQPKQ